MEHDERLTEKQKQVITDELRKLKEPSFVEIERIFKNQGIPYSGECSFNSHINDHVYFWTELTKDISRFILEFVTDNHLHFIPASKTYGGYNQEKLLLPIVSSRNPLLQQYLINGTLPDDKAKRNSIIRKAKSISDLYWIPLKIVDDKQYQQYLNRINK